MRDVASQMIGKKNTVPAFGFTFFTPKEPRKHQSGTGRGMSGSIFTLISSSSPSFSSGMVAKGLVTSNSGDINLYQSSVNESKTETKSSGSWLGGKKSYSNALNDKSDDLKLCSDGGPIMAGDPIPCAASLGVDTGPVEPEKLTKCAALSLRERLDRHKEMKKKSFSSKGVLRSAEKPVKEVSIGAGAKIRQALNADSYPLDSWKEIPDASMTIYFIFHEKFEELKAKGMRDISGAKEGMLANIPVG